MQAYLQRGGPNGAIYRCSKSGWMNEELFLDWMVHFKEHTGATLDNHVLLILDNHTSHISLDIYNYCRENGIHMVTLPPHTSHRTQPLDLTVFGPLKTALHKECQAYMNRNKYEKLTPLELIPLFTKSYLKIANAEKAASGFQAAGIWPFDPNVFERLAEEGDDNLVNEYTTEQAITYLDVLDVVTGLEPPDVSTNIPESPQPSTSAQNKPVQLEELNAISQCSTPSLNEANYVDEQEVIIYSESKDEDIPCDNGQVLKPSESPSIMESFYEEMNNKTRIESNPSEEIQIFEPTLESIERVRRKILISPTLEVSFCNISPIPDKTKVREKGKGHGKRTQHSIILTSTPMKLLLENKAEKKKIKQETEARANEIKKHNKRIMKTDTAKDLKKQNICKKTKKSSKEGKIIKLSKKSRKDYSSSSEVDENILCDDGDDDDCDGKFYDDGQSRIDELCIICGEFGKNRELWYRCVSCGNWTHALCSGEDSADNYLCILCKK